MQCNLSSKKSERIVRIADKASFNRQWTELVRGIQELPEVPSTEPVEENPLIQYVYGHRKLDQYLFHLRNKAHR